MGLQRGREEGREVESWACMINVQPRSRRSFGKTGKVAVPNNAIWIHFVGRNFGMFPRFSMYNTGWQGNAPHTKDTHTDISTYNK